MPDTGAHPPPGAPLPEPAARSWFAPPGGPLPPPAQPGGYVDPRQLLPPGAAPAAPPPGYAPPAPAPLLAAMHKPGAIPIRPLGLGDIFDGAFKVIRFSPGATVGSAVLVAAVAMAIPVLIAGLLTTVLDLSLSSVQNVDSTTTTTASDLAADSTLLGGFILQAIGLIFVTGMIAQVTAAAVIGRRLSLGEAWAATAGKRLKLVGLSALLFAATLLYIVLSVLVVVLFAQTMPSDAAVVTSVLFAILAACGLVFLWGRLYYLAVPPLMLEPIGIWGALGRSWKLTSRQFWRTFGIALLTIMVTQIVGGILGVPFTLVGDVATSASGDGEAGLMIFLATTALANVISSAFVAPFTSSVTTLQYIDQRMRKEGYDVELLTREIGR